MIDLKERQQEIDNLLWRIDVTRLRIKYSKNIFETMAIAIDSVCSTMQLATIISKPNPKFVSGGVDIGVASGDTAVEYIISNEGNKIEIKSIRNGNDNSL